MSAILLKNENTGLPTVGPPTVIIGLGLVGTAIQNALRSSYLDHHYIAFSEWSEPPKLNAHLWSLATAADQCKKINFIWSAGRVGFSADEASCHQEFLIFETFVNFLAKHYPLGPDLRIHFISSAGGLYGEGFTTSIEAVKPTSPYGKLKLRQEQLLRDKLPEATVYCHRLSSVYGHIKRGHRMGLINTLIANCLNNRPSIIYGNSDTFRDYVFSEDIANYIGKLCHDALSEQPLISVLYSGRPTTIANIIRIVEATVSKRCLCSFTAQKSNSVDIVISNEVRPFLWQTTDLRTAVVKIAKKYRGEASAF